MDEAISDDEIDEFRKDMLKAIVESQPRGCIVDFSEVKQYGITTTKIRSLGRSSPAATNMQLLVIIVAPDTCMYGSARMFQLLSEEKRPWIRVVRSATEAYQILRIDSPVFEILPSDPEQRKAYLDGIPRDN